MLCLCPVHDTVDKRLDEQHLHIYIGPMIQERASRTWNTQRNVEANILSPPRAVMNKSRESITDGTYRNNIEQIAV